MKKIINHRVYDTDAATEIGEQEWGDIIEDSFTYACEKLYRKRNGEYFIHGEGGPRTCYGQSAGLGNMSWGARIIPQSYEQAREWAEQNLSAEAYEREFGVVEDDTEVVLSVRVSTSARAALDRYVAATGRTRTDIVSELLMSLTA